MKNDIPLEIINIICSYRERHPIMNIICCCNCGENDIMYVYHNFVKQKFKIICLDCNYEMNKE